MPYPDKLVAFENGCTLYIPVPEKIKAAYEYLLAKDEKTKFPYWAKIWPSAIALTSFLKDEPAWIENKTVLELGAGIGLPSFVMAPHAKKMIISDHDIEAVSLIEKNRKYLNLKHVSAMCIDWNHFPDETHAETILLSDLNYAPDQFDSLLQLIRKFIEQGSVIILSTPHRITAAPFAEALRPFIKRSVQKMTAYGNELTEIWLLILSN